MIVNMNKIKDNQLRWVILLLAIAVILPTVCLLWFMTQAVKNERLAIRQKLIDSYTARGEEIFLNSQFPINDQNQFSAFVIYDQNDKIIYPVPPSRGHIYSSPKVQNVWKLEFSDANYAGALAEYSKIAIISSIPAEVYEASMGKIRCLIIQGKFNDAIKICLDFAYPGKHIIKEFIPEQIARAKLMLANLYAQSKKNELLMELQNQFSDILINPLPTETQVFVLEELITIAEKEGFAEKLNTEIEKSEKIIKSALLSISTADYLEKYWSIKNWPMDNFKKISLAQSLYGIYFKQDNKKILELLSENKMSRFWQKNVDDFTDELVFCRVSDDKGQLISGQEVSEGELFSTLKLKDNFSGWKAELYLRSGVFKEAADKKRYIYFWVASIVIILMLSSTLLASKAVLKQAKLNKLKNDFIATITHELKTPLSSMRVLVDTLLEGKCENKQQETEYLQLIAKENMRLSRLIDNFLTFSRMERNKQVFEIAPASPVEIANNAAEAVQAKFEKAGVFFSLSASNHLPMINADKDAMTTVLVNLLDNAYKYSNEKKQIELNVFTEKTEVCFAVKDNGIGMTRRQVKKVFDRFYQADTSLSRQAEGSGLGLSIVKFIVDAHKGKIDVESKIGKGSVFTVRLNYI